MRPVPHSVEAEACALGCCALSVKGAAVVASVLEPEDFYIPAHRTMFAAVLRLIAKRSPVDLVTWSDELGSDLERIGGLEYLIQVQESVPSAHNAAYYADIVRDFTAKRRLGQAAETMARLAYDPDADPSDSIAEARAAIAVIGTGRRPWKDAGEVIAAMSEDVPRALPTCFPSLDAMTSFRGFTKGEPHVVRGDTGKGKSLVAAQLARHWAVANGLRVAVVSLELTADFYMRRMLFQDTGFWSVSHADKSGHKELYEAKKAEYGHADLYLLDYSYEATATTLSDVCADIRALHALKRLDAVILDYVQLIVPKGSRGDFRDHTQNARAFKLLAKETGVCLVEVSQSKMREGRMQTRGGGEYDDAAASIWTIDRKKHGEDKQWPQGYDRIHSNKARHGKESFIDVVFSESRLEFVEKVHASGRVYRGGE